MLSKGAVKEPRLQLTSEDSLRKQVFLLAFVAQGLGHECMASILGLVSP